MRELANNTKILLIKIIHTAIWCVMVTAIFYVLYAGIFDSVSVLTWFCIGLVFIEVIILLIYKWKCPLTILAKNYTNNHSVGFDIFLPAWLAKINKVVFSILFSIGLALVLWRAFV